MPTLKIIGLTIVVLGLVFTWGYRGEDWFGPKKTPTPVTPTDPDAPEVLMPVPPMAGEFEEDELNAPAPATRAFVPDPSPKMQAYSSAPATAREKDTFSRTIEAISPGQIQEQQELRRNLYFERLSQQLKELQGELPPEPMDEATRPQADSDEEPLTDPIYPSRNIPFQAPDDDNLDAMELENMPEPSPYPDMLGDDIDPRLEMEDEDF